MSNTKQMTLIYYIVPQDSDELETPNAFGIQKPIDKITIHDIRQAFPLNGQYIFRFMYKTHNQTVWMDLNAHNQTTPVPVCNNRIFIKATRIDWENKPQAQSIPQNIPASQRTVEQVVNAFIPIPETIPKNANNLIDF